MGSNNTAGLSLFDLLARDWVLDGKIVQTAFNHDDTGFVFRLDSGELALASTKDAESPKIRTRLDLESGRTTIRPREDPISPLIKPDSLAQKDIPIVRFRSESFAIIDQEGALQQITVGGQVVPKLKAQGGPVTSMCSSATGKIIAVAHQTRVILYDTDDMHVLADVVLDHAVTCQAFSQEGGILAAWGGGTLSLIDIMAPLPAPQIIPCDGDITEISWQESGSHLACASADNSFVIINCAAGTAQQVKDFPNPVRNTAFNDAGNALVASGAFRLAGWDSSDLPEHDLPGTPLVTGKPGFVILNAIASHPKRNLVATGYANGLVTIASIGTSQDMMLHQENATEISSLCWSKTGEHLAIGCTSGKAALVTFPSQMFK